MKDKQIEQLRYNVYSQNILSLIGDDNAILHTLGADNFPLYLRPPYLFYHNLIHNHTIGSKKQLDLCCGNGMHSFTGAYNGANVIGLDYAEKSISICKKRNTALNLNVEFRTADVQVLHGFSDNEFDVVTCAGSLSYVDHELLFSEINRVLKSGGVFICVDSINHNPIYRLNRFIHYLRGLRSLSTIKRIPNMSTIKYLNQNFTKVEVHYFGIFIFLVPILKLFMSTNGIFKAVNYLDKVFSCLKRFSFKIVITAIK